MTDNNHRGSPDGRPPKAVVAERERRAWEMAKAGHSQAAIAEALGVRQSTVSKMLARKHKRVLKELDQAALALKMGQVDGLRHVHDEAMAAWERSKQPAMAVTYKEAGPPSADPGQARRREVTVTTEEAPVGDVAFLKIALQALADIRKTLGLDAARGVELKPIRDPEEQPERERIIVEEDSVAAALVHLYEAGHPRVVALVQSLANGGGAG